MSLGQILENWGEEGQESSDMMFKENTNNNNYSSDVLGKRGMEVENRGMFCPQEPTLKRYNTDQMCVRKGISNISLDEKEMFQMTMRRESEFNDDCDVNGNIDLMDFNSSGLYSWTKSL